MERKGKARRGERKGSVVGGGGGKQTIVMSNNWCGTKICISDLLNAFVLGDEMFDLL